MAGHKTHSVALKRQVVQEYLSGETLHGLARRHNLPRNLIRLWVDEDLYPTRDGELSEAPALDDIAALAQTIYECETRIEAIERIVARRAAEFGTRREERPQGQEPGDGSD
ncbi:MAG: transposase [Acidobacteriota bacterium]|nr:transposase [Acidobacteriota bacterium]